MSVDICLQLMLIHKWVFRKEKKPSYKKDTFILKPDFMFLAILVENKTPCSET